MSRIDEALRRSRGQGEPVHPPEAEADPLAEQFPRETESWAGADATVIHSEPTAPPPAPEPRATPPQAPQAPPAPSHPAAAANVTSRVTPISVFDHLHEALAEKVVADARLAALPREQYRRLAAVLHDVKMNRGVSVLMVASAMPAEGKTLTATNLALTLSESYQDRVLLIDADLRRPALHDVFMLSAGTGLLEGLEATNGTKLVVRQVTPRLSILPAGRPTSDPMAALTSERMKSLVSEARQTFDWVILDTPPLMLLPDAHLLSTLVDGAVLVVRANTTPHDAVRRAIDAIGRERVTGVVLNYAQASDQTVYGHSAYYEYGTRHLEHRR
jgi:capsular exopolysaccharide synthesis family protein